VSLNLLGNYIRERRQDLGLTQEDLAARIGGTATQAEISRLERGTIILPRRARLDALASALEVSIGALLMHSGWLTQEEGDDVDAESVSLPQSDTVTLMAMLAETERIRQTLLTAIEQTGVLERTIRATLGSGRRPDVNPPVGLFDDWETAAMVYL
jgi:transcriptional regulator with XRE-family HTH domain